MTNLIISNEEMIDIIKIAKSFEDSSLLIKGVSETIKNELKENIGRILIILFVTLDVSLSGNIWTGKDTIRADEEQLELIKTFNYTSSYNYFWNTKVLSKEP